MAESTLQPHNQMKKTLALLLSAVALQMAVTAAQTNAVPLRVPSPVNTAEPFSITVYPEPGHKIQAVILVVEREKPSKTKIPAFDVFFEQPPKGSEKKATPTSVRAHAMLSPRVELLASPPSEIPRRKF